MRKKGKYDKLIAEFKQHPIFARDELLTFFHKNEPELKEATFAWRIYDLKKHYIINDLKKGIYTLNSKASFKPELNKQIITIGKLIGREHNHEIF